MDVTGSNNSKSVSSLVPAGRVVRIHFTCRAELPMGSSLRVTGSSLWAPTSLTSPSDPMNAHAIAQETAATAGFPAFGNDTEDSLEYWFNNTPTNLYASSVEMVTTPDTYPVWKTKQPVVIVLNETTTEKKSHYYRYLVVTPGASHATEMDILGDGEVQTMDISTSDGHDGTVNVMMWEEPDFPDLERLNIATGSIKMTSTGSITGLHASASQQSINTGVTSVIGNDPSSPQNQFLRLAQMPYRTLDINVETAEVMNPQPDDRIDTWNRPDDTTFKAYVIREVMQRSEAAASATKRVEERRKDYFRSQSSMSDGNISIIDDAPVVVDNTGDVDMTNIVVSAASSSASLNTSNVLANLPPKILFICFHLPVVVVKVDGEWQASWSESLLASKEGSKIVAHYRAHWIGTVTPQPPIENEDDKQAIRQVLAKMECTPIFLDPTTRQEHYYGFCKQVLWPAFHNIDLLDLSISGTDGNNSNGKDNATNANENTVSASDWDQSRLDDWWRAFQKVNKEFATVVEEIVGQDPGHMIDRNYLWIHDYHLALLPKYLCENNRVTKYCRKVFFLHIPFPTSQIFRELECGEEILQGMLHADVVGFHAFDHARHFLNANKRIMGLNYENLVGGLIGVNYMGRTILVSMSNVSIEPHMIDAALKLPVVETECNLLRQTHGDRSIVCGVEVGQRLSGTSLKLLAYERLLQDYPTWQPKVVMVLRILLPGSRKRDEQITIRELRQIVQRIQEKFGTAVIDYKEISGSTLPMAQRLALWKASDVLVLTPIREGLNHWPLEYIYSKRDTSPGVVIASEFSAVCSILNGALRVNPFDIQMTVTIMDKALSMDSEEKEGRRYRDLDFVSNSPSDRWVKNVLRDMNDAYMASTSTNKKSTDGSPRPGMSTPPRSSGSRTPRHRRTASKIRREEVQGTAAFLLKESHKSFTHMKPKVLKQAYDVSKRRVIILDFNGTIVLKEPPGKYLKREILGTSGNKPPPQVLEALALLCRDPRNTVYVNSGDSSENVLNALGHIHNLGLAVSNGAKFSPPMQDKDEERRWQTFDLGVDWDAVKRVALPVLSKYTARSNGSFVKLTTFSIGWSYYSCDPEWGSLQASHLVLELEAELKAFDVRLVTLKGIVEIVPRKLNKGLIVKKVLRDIAKTSDESPIDFCLCLGDDISDEKMFTSVFSFIAEMGDPSAAHLDPPVYNADGSLEKPKPTLSLAEKPVPDPMYCFACAVGKKPSSASMYVTDAYEVVDALVLLAKGEFPQGGDHPTWGNNQNMFT